MGMPQLFGLNTAHFRAGTIQSRATVRDKNKLQLLFKPWLVRDSLPDGRVRLRNLAEGYELVIESMDMGQGQE